MLVLSYLCVCLFVKSNFRFHFQRFKTLSTLTLLNIQLPSSPRSPAIVIYYGKRTHSKWHRIFIMSFYQIIKKFREISLCQGAIRLHTDRHTHTVRSVFSQSQVTKSQSHIVTVIASKLQLHFNYSKMANNWNQPLVFTAYKAAVLDLLQALYPHVNRRTSLVDYTSFLTFFNFSCCIFAI